MSSFFLRQASRLFNPSFFKITVGVSVCAVPGVLSFSNSSSSHLGVDPQAKHDWHVPAASTLTFPRKAALVVIGKTNVGKSSLIGLCCDPSGDQPGRGHGTAPCTSTPELYRDALSVDITWLDTPGTDDLTQTDDEIRRQIFQTLYENDISQIKVIWFPSDVETECGSNADEAAFIASLAALPSTQRTTTAANQRKRAAIWDSCLMVWSKNAKAFQPTKAHMPGTIAAANKACMVDHEDGNTIVDARLIGYNVIEWINPALEPQLKHLQDPNAEKECGYVHAGEVAPAVRDKLQAMPFFLG